MFIVNFEVKLYYKLMLNKLLDMSVYFSFDKTGFERHQKSFNDIDVNLFNGKTIIITGGTSGIGEALALRLSTAQCTIIVTGRNKEKYIKSSLSHLSNVKFFKLDLANFEEVRNFSNNVEVVDFLICNAGGMPNNLNIIKNKYDTIFASQVVGHYILIDSLYSMNKLNNSCVHINSSGGMYLVKMNLTDLKWEHKTYDKVASYANAKRSQVIMCEELVKLYPEIHFTCSHPGWVATDAVKESIPGFYNFTKNRLRTSDQGADTIYWCMAHYSKLKNGGFYFDRKLRNPYIFPWTRPSAQDRKKLIELLSN